jgi:hypothetical protein
VLSRHVAAAVLFSVVLARGVCAAAREPDCAEGEGPDLLAARIQWFVETYGVNGAFDPQRRLEAVRKAYAEYLAERTARRVAPEALAVGAFRFLGPVNGAGRAPAVEPHPKDPTIVWVGAAGGGCWKSTDSGATWRALTDGLGDLSVGAVAAAPSDPSVVYLATGEGGYSGDFIPGIGVFRSTDGGETWRVPDFVVSPMFYRLSVDPRNADVLLALSADGMLRSTDGAASFATVSDAAWGDAVDVARDPTNPDVVHATFWRLGQSESGRYARSTNGGQTWQVVSTGLPPDPKGRMSLGISSDGRTLYTLIAGPSALRTQIGLWRSTDGGTTWRAAALFDPSTNGTPDILSGQGGYDNAVAVDPDDARTIVLGGGASGHWRSTDGGETVVRAGREDGVHVDVHQLVFKRTGASKVLWTANDGGVWRSTDGGVRWTDRNAGLATRQYYSVALDAARPAVLYAGSQDNGTSRRGDDSPLFSPATSGDGFESAVSPDSPGTVYTSGQFATVFRSNSDGGATTFTYVSQPLAGQAFSRDGGDGVKPFFTRVVLDPDAPGTLYTGTYRPWRSRDQGTTWEPLGGTLFAPTSEIRALAVSKGRILVAQRTRLFLSDDGGATFRELTGYAPVGALEAVEIDPSDPRVFWVTSSFFTQSHPVSVACSTNSGASWNERSNGLPEFGIGAVRVDPTDPLTVYAGTGVGLYRSTDAGLSWARFGEGLPAVAVFDVRVAPDASRLVVATHGRGLWQADAPLANHPPAVVIDSPSARVTIPVGGSVSFAGRASDADGDAITGYRWDLGDGMTASSSATGPIVYRTPGSYRVSLVAVDAKGGRGVAFADVDVVPPNDACGNAMPIALVPGATVSVRTGNGATETLDASDPTTCSEPGISNSIWFTVTPPSDGTLDLDTFGSFGDTVMALYGGSCAAPGPALACSDDAQGVAGGPSQLPTQTVSAGATYRVLVASWSDPLRGFVGPVESVRVNARFTPSTSGAPSAGATAVLPVVLDAFGKNGARFQSDLTVLNAGSSPAALALTYGGRVAPGANPTSAISLEPGEEVHVADALAELRREGIAVPPAADGASQIGSLAFLESQGDASALVVSSRVATPNPNVNVGGTFGTFAAGVRFEDAADADPVTVFGLRQTDRDRANLALVHVPTAHTLSAPGAPITLSIDVLDASGRAAPRSPLTVTLAEGEWTQLGEVLALAGLDAGAADGGVARVTRTAGAGRFVVYGVVNDQKTADGSIVPMSRAGRLRAGDTLLVPVVLEAGGLAGSFFTTELVVASRSAAAGSVTLRYVPSPLFSGTAAGSVTIPIAAGAQLVLPDLVQLLRVHGVAIPSGSSQGGALFVTFQGLPAGDDVFAGARIATPNPDQAQGGAFGVFLPAVPSAELATTSALVPGLRRDSGARANLAAVNAGEGPVTLSVSLRSPVDGTPLGPALTRTLGPGEWYQWSNVFAAAGLAGGEAWALVTRTSGSAPWSVYGVLNDEKTSDGSVIGGVSR